MDLASIKKFFASLTLQKLVPVILIVVIGLLLVKLLLKLFDRVLERSRLERTMFSFLRAAMRALLYTILVLVAASSLGVDVTSLVAILSVVSLAISLAVQNALSNVVGSVTLLTTHPFHVGDFVEIGSDSGTVEEISVSYTKLATVDGKRIYIPNSDAASARICNYSVEGRRRVDLYIGVSYDAPAEKVREALLAAAQHPKALQDPAPLVVLNNYQDSSIQYLLMLWAASASWTPAASPSPTRSSTCILIRRSGTPDILIYSQSSGAPAGFRFCHSEERSDVGISCNRLRFRRGLLVIQYGTARLPRPLRGLAMTIPEPCSVLTARAAAQTRRCSFLPAYFPQLPQQAVPPQSLPSG